MKPSKNPNESTETGSASKPARPQFDIEALEPRILLSATWVDADTGEETGGASDGSDVFTGDDMADVVNSLEGDDQLFGGAGDDQLAGGAGDDLLQGGSGDDVIDGGAGSDVADYSDAPSAVQVDLTETAAQDTGGAGTDTLAEVEGVVGSNFDDTFSFSSPTAGASYTVDGGGGSNTIDLANHGSEDAAFSNDSGNDGKVVVHLEGEQSFEVEFESIDHVQFSDLQMDLGDLDGAPTADAGLDQTVGEGDTVSLSGQASSDPSDDDLTYSWTQIDGPQVNLAGADTAQPTFDAPDVGDLETLTFRLEVSDGEHTRFDTIEVEVLDPAVADVRELSPSEFRNLSPDQVQYLSPEQLEGITNANHFYYMSSDARAELSAEQVQALDTSNISIGYLTTEQREDLSPEQIEDLSADRFRYVPAGQVEHLTPEQLEGITNANHFYYMSSDARSELNAEQVQALDTSNISIGYLTTEQREDLSSEQIEDLSADRLRYVPASQVEHLTPEQLEGITNANHFYYMSSDARAELSAEQVQALDTSNISIGYLTTEQREDLSSEQIEDLSADRLRYVPAGQVEHLTPEQLEGITNANHFYYMSSDARSELNAEQVQALDTSNISIGYLTTEQREDLSSEQIEDLSADRLRYVPASQVEHLTPEQLEGITNANHFYYMSSDARAELSAEQVQALDTSNISIGYLTTEQREDLSSEQIEDLSADRLRYVPAGQVEHLTPEQLEGITNANHFYYMSSDARAELSAEQVQALDTSNISIGYLTTEQREDLSPEQIEDLSVDRFRYVPAGQVEHLTPEQLEGITNANHFYYMSSDARAELSAEQVQSLDTSNISIGYLTTEQREDLSSEQIEDLSADRFRYVPASQVEHLTPEQLEGITNANHFYYMSSDARAELNEDQVQALDTSTISIRYLTTDQRDMLTIDQLQDVSSGDLRYLSPEQLERLDGNDAPTALAGEVTMNEDVETGIHFSATDPESGESVEAYRIDSLPDHGELRLNGEPLASGATVTQAEIDGGALTFQPDENWNGSTSLEFSAFDGELYSEQSATFDIDVTAQNDAPIVENGSVTLDEDGEAMIRFSATDPDSGDAVESYRIDSLPEHGELRLNGVPLASGATVTQADIDGGALTLQPEDNWNGSTSLEFSAYDGETYSDQSATFDIDVTAQNDAPIVENGGVTVNEDGEATLTFSATDPDTGDAVEAYRIDSLPEHGELRLNGEPLSSGATVTQADIDGGALTFQPDENWNGSTSLEFSAFDGETYSEQSATFDIDVAAQNDAPVVENGSVTLDEDGEAMITFSATDPDTGDAVEAYRIDRLPEHGELRLNGEPLSSGATVTQADIDGGALTFQPDDNWNGSTSLEFSAYDGDTYSEQSATFDIDVTARNDAPIVENGSVTLDEDGEATVTFSATDPDTGDAVEAYRIDSLPEHGELRLNGEPLENGATVTQADIDHGALTFHPHANWHGSTSLEFSAYDGETYSAQSATFDIEVESMPEKLAPGEHDTADVDETPLPVDPTSIPGQQVDEEVEEQPAKIEWDDNEELQVLESESAWGDRGSPLDLVDQVEDLLAQQEDPGGTELLVPTDAIRAESDVNRDEVIEVDAAAALRPVTTTDGQGSSVPVAIEHDLGWQPLASTDLSESQQQEQHSSGRALGFLWGLVRGLGGTRERGSTEDEHDNRSR